MSTTDKFKTDLRTIWRLRDEGALSWGESMKLVCLVTAERDRAVRGGV